MENEGKNMLTKQICDIEEIKKRFSNKNNIYYGHGTNSDDVVNSIFSTGLYCSKSRDTIYWTTCELGRGSENSFDRNSMKFKIWPHLEAKKIVIVSFPPEYEFYSESNMVMQSALIENKKISEGAIEEGYLKPEFILGMYDVEQEVFYDNPKYYENLDPEQQMEIFDEAKRKYIEVVRETVLSSRSTFTAERERLKALGKPNLLTEAEASKLDEELPELDNSNMSFIDMVNFGDFANQKQNFEGMNIDFTNKRQQNQEKTTDVSNLSVDEDEIEWD